MPVNRLFSMSSSKSAQGRLIEADWQSDDSRGRHSRHSRHFGDDSGHSDEDSSHSDDHGHSSGHSHSDDCSNIATIGFFDLIPVYGVEGAAGSALEFVIGNDKKNTLSGEVLTAGGVRIFGLAGGEKSDIYEILPGQQVIIADSGGGRNDTVDLTAIDRQNGLFGYVRIGSYDYLLADAVSGTVTLYHDPFGVLSKDNAIEWVKAQLRIDAVTVDPTRTELISFADWVGTQSAKGLNLGLYFQAAAPQLFTSDGSLLNYDAYNVFVGGLQQTPNLSAVLQGVLSAANNPNIPAQVVAPLLASLINDLPLTPELGFLNDSAVQTAWLELSAAVDACS